MRNILLTIEYDGTRFCGWQRQPNARTVQGEIEAALTKLIGREILIDGTSRTDAGVHANGQQASFALEDSGIPTDRIAKALNDILAFDKLEGIGDIKILKAEEKPEGFHARYSAKGKRYIYRIYNASEKSPFRRSQFYQIAESLDLDAMKKAAAFIIGTHDFKSFETSGSTVHESTVRTITRLDIEHSKQDSKMIEVSIEGDGFLYNMVRIIVGTLVEVGLHKKTPAEIEKIINAKDRSQAGHTAPPQGLYLDEVFY